MYYIRQTFIDLENEQDIEEIQNFLAESKIYLDKKLPFNTLNELIATILSCFKHYSKELLKFLDEYINNVKTNENYIILTSTILSYLTNSQVQLNFPDYHQFVSEALYEILPQINNDQQLIVFDHEIPINYKKELVIDLLLSIDLTEKLIFDFFPFIIRDFPPLSRMVNNFFFFFGLCHTKRLLRTWHFCCKTCSLPLSS